MAKQSMTQPSAASLTPGVMAFGAAGSVVNSPQGASANPSLGPDLFTQPTNVGAGYSIASSGSLTGNSTNQTLIWRLNIGAFTTNSANADTCYRIQWNLSNTVTAGWAGLFYEFVDASGVLIAGTARHYLYADTTAITGYLGVFDVKAPVGTVNLHVGLQMANNVPSGTLTLNSCSVHRVAYAQPPVVVGKAADIGHYRVIRPITDPKTRAVTWAGVDIYGDGALEYALREQHVWNTGTFFRSAIDGSDSIAQQCPQMTRSVTWNATLPIWNSNGHVMDIINGSGAAELRCNSHGGESGRSGTEGTDYIRQIDLGDGVWHVLPVTASAVSALAWFCKRFQFVQHTKVVATTGETVANIDYTWTFYDDGTVRQDRTVTFLRSQAMFTWFVTIASFTQGGQANPFVAVGKIGSGRNVHGLVDYRQKVTVPTITSVVNSTTGGTLPAATKNYRITRRTANGETTPSASVTGGANTGTTSSNTITFPATVTGQTGWGVYDDNGLLAYVTTVPTTYVDTGAVAGSTAAPTANTGWFLNGTTVTNDNTMSTTASWVAYQEAITGICYGKVIDRADIIKQHPSATGVRLNLEAAAGITKIYAHLESANGGGITGGTQANGYYPVTVPNGTVVTNTTFDLTYLPADTAKFEVETALRDEAGTGLAAAYPIV